MKKKALVAAVLAATTLTATSAFAAQNPFKDVPSDHWAYDAIAMLAEDGILEGYGDGTFNGTKSMNRYEMAEIVSKVVAKYDTARPADKGAIKKLEKEFSNELKDMDVRLSNLEKDVAGLKGGMKWYGDARLRYFKNKKSKDHSGQSTNGVENASVFEKRVRLGIYAEPAKNLSVDGRLKYEDSSYENRGSAKNYVNDIWHDSGTLSNHDAFRLDKFSLNWNHAGTKVSAGRTELSLGQGLLYWENPVDGLYVQHNFGPHITAMAGWGDISAATWQAGDQSTFFGNIGIKTSPATSITLAALHTVDDHFTNAWKNTDWSIGSDNKTYKLNQYSVGVNSQLANKWNLITEAVTNNAGDYKNKHGVWTRLTYGKQVWNQANTWNIYGEYFALGGGSIDSTGWQHRLNIAGGDGLGKNGARGWGLGVGYMLAANTNFEITYYALKPYDKNCASFDDYNSTAYAALSYSF